MTTAPDRNLSNFDENAHHIAKRQYLQEGDGDLSGMFRRIADWVAGAETPEARLSWAQKYYDLMAEKKFCPGGRVLAGAGTQHGNVLNCLQGDTLVETRGGQARIADLSGKVEVLSQGGLYRTAHFRSYGRQELYRVLFENGETVEATAGHEWPVGKKGKSGRYRKVTTLELIGQFVPVLPTGRRPAQDEDFEAGVRHGVTYGDGSKNTNGHTYHVQLFGAKRALTRHFGGFRVHDAVYAGREVTVAQGMRGELKTLPDELSSDAYWHGFFCGLLATDGGVDDRGSAAIYQSDADELARLARQLTRFGVKAASIKLFRQADAGYGGKPGYALRLIKQTLRPEDFLREDQRERFERSLVGQTQPRNASLRVLGVEPTGRTEEVFCCEEPQTHTFVIQGGLMTGNCFVQGATEHAPESFDGVMEVAKKLALVTKVGGGNGVNLDVYTPRAVSSRPDAGVRGWAYMSATHPDVTDFIDGLMRPPTQPDGEKQPVAVRNWTRVVYGHAIPPELVASARMNGVQIVRALPEGVQPVADDMGGIIDAARAVAESAKVGVEPRIDLSEMRPEGAPIKGSGGTSSGPVSFLMEIFDNFLEWANRGGETSGPINTLRFVYAPVLRVVRQGGTRRGAGMATISIEHPDVLDFLTAKDLDREAAEGDISTFNISILVTEKFWQTLSGDGLWHVDVQDVPGKYYLEAQAGMYDGRLPSLPERAEDGARGVPLYRTAPQGRYNPADKRPGIPAKWLWDQIAQHAWATGEPGLIFVDRVNEYSALKGLGKRYEIRSTNPCVTGDTLVAVADGRGAVSFRELSETGVDVPVYAKDDRGDVAVRWMRNPRVTGYDQSIYEVTFDDGLKVRVTGNHRFNLTDGTAREALALQPGDSVASLTRFEGNFDDALGFAGKRSQDYVWLTTGKGQPIGEHRLIACFELGRPLKAGEVVHHRDYNGLNNHGSNLEVMSREAHEALHRADMLGDNNPMRERWWGQLTEVEKDAYRSRMSAATSGERNGRHSGLSHDELEEAARELARSLGRGFTNREWQAYAKERGLPQSFSDHRESELGSVNALSERVANELGLPVLPRGVGQSRQAVHNFDLYQSALASGYVAVRHEDNFYPIVTRACEDCGTHYEQPWSRREVSYCRPCGLKRASAAGREGVRAAMGRISENTSERQVRAFNDLKFRLGRRPMKAEWEAHCQEAGVPVRLHPGGLPTYAALTERASVANHRVVSVEYVGREDVYNGTVDEFHNYYIGHHTVSVSDEKIHLTYVNTVNCGEIPLTVGEPCDLGAINLAAYVKGSTFDYATFRADVRTCVRFLDDVLDVNVFALEDNRVASQDLRRLGLGVMGLADALIKMGLRYDNEAGRTAIYEIMGTLREEAVAESERLGQERGVYPVYGRNAKKIPHGPRRNVAVLTVAPTGCVVPNTLVSTDRGMRRIVTLGNPSGKQWQDIQLGVHTDEGVRAATKFFVNGYRPVRRVTTTRGFSMAATENHRVRAIDGEGNYVWRRMDELNVGDMVLLKRNTLDDAPMAQLELAEIGVNGVSTVPDRMSPDLAELLGLYMGDGYLKEKGGLHIVVANVDADLKERVAAQLMRVFTSRTAPVEERIGCAVVAVNGRCISRFFALNNLAKPKGAAGEGAEGAFIPDAVLASGAGAVRAFMRGLFESDGTVTPQGGVALSSVSLTLLQQTQAALLGLGIVSGIRQMPTSGGRFGQRPIFELRLLNRHEVARFREQIGFLSARKQAKLASIAKGYAKCDVITHPRLLEEFYQASKGLDNQTRQGLNKRVHSNGALSQPYIKDLTARHPQLHDTRLGRLVALDVFVDTVAVIEEGFSETYDLSVPENVTYVAGGFISHNTTSMLMGVSSGIEPVFSPFIWRKIGSEYRALLAPLFVELLNQYPAPAGLEKDGGWDWDKVTEAISENHGSVVGLVFIPEALQQVFVCAHDIKPEDHVRMQGTVQRAFDDGGQHAANSLSKTINLPNSATVEDVQSAYSEAYKTGCKGITVYRDGSRQFQVLSTSKKKEKKAEETPAEAVAEVMGEKTEEVVTQPEVQSAPAPAAVPVPLPRPAAHNPQPTTPVYERPVRLQGITDMVKLTDPTSGHRRSFLVTVNHLGGKPIEVMVISGRAGDEANADSEALGRVVSIALQHGVPAQALIKTLRGINGGLYGSYNGRLVGSKADLIAVALETFQKDMDAASLPPLAGASVDAPALAPAVAAPSGVSVEGLSRERCPVCEERAVIREEGCLKCQACGYSKCG